VQIFGLALDEPADDLEPEQEAKPHAKKGAKKRAKMGGCPRHENGLSPGAQARRTVMRDHELRYVRRSQGIVSTFYRLLISQNFEVKIGFIVKHLRDITGIEPVNQPAQFDQNIERIFADLHGEMHRRMANGDANGGNKDDIVAEIVRVSIDHYYQ
jgi:hypothetical protein